MQAVVVTVSAAVRIASESSESAAFAAESLQVRSAGNLVRPYGKARCERGRGGAGCFGKAAGKIPGSKQF